MSEGSPDPQKPEMDSPGEENISTGDQSAKNPKERGLGRGLDALFGEDADDEPGEAPGKAGGASAAPQIAKANQSDSIAGTQIVGVDRLQPSPMQPRQYFDKDAIEQLAASIKTHGVLQPLLVRPIEGEEVRYEIVAGERRWRAAQKAQLHEVPIVIQSLSDEQVVEIALIENLQRESLNPIEEAQAYQRLIKEFGYTQEQLAAQVHKSRPHIANMMRLLELPEAVKIKLVLGNLTVGHARALLGAEKPEMLAQQVIDQNLSVRDTEKLVAQNKQGNESLPPSAKPKAEKDPDTRALEAEMTERLGMKVTLQGKGKSGKLVIAYKNLDQLDDLLHRLSHNSAE